MVIEVAFENEDATFAWIEADEWLIQRWKPKVTACYEKIWRSMAQHTLNVILSKNKCKISIYEIFIEHHERTMKTTEKGNK